MQMPILARFLLLALFALPPVLAPLAGARAADASGGGFVEGFAELPLMPGLVALRDQSVTFAQPGGRIVQAVARGPVSAEAVRKFYRETVPQLGWHHAAGDDRFVRDGEVLRLEVHPAPADASGRPQVTVRFSLSPE